MNATMSESGESLTERDITALERHVGAGLPLPYRQFLLEYNGGRVSPDCFDFNRNGEEDGSMVDWFLRIGDEGWSNMYKYLEVYKDRVPDGFMPIAHDPGGNLILISLQGDGRIYYWDHDEEVEEGQAPGTRNVYLVANSFPEFLDSLYDIVV